MIYKNSGAKKNLAVVDSACVLLKKIPMIDILQLWEGEFKIESRKLFCTIYFMLILF